MDHYSSLKRRLDYDLDCHFFDSIDSTNSFLANSPYETKTQLCVTREQTKGYGQHGRKWASQKDGSIIFSIRKSFHEHTNINGLSLVGSGETFPTSGTTDGDYFLRTDFSPNRLFKKSGTRWLNVGTDGRKAWSAANRILATFINNDNITSESDGTDANEKTNLSKVIKPRTDN